jgi:TatA/E family protein of Tat protein translocase
MFGMGMPEILLILALALIVIGPKKLPDIAKAMGRAMREFKKATTELKETMEIDDQLKDVKDAFQDVNTDLKESVDFSAPPPPSPAEKQNDAETDLTEDQDLPKATTPAPPEEGKSGNASG